MWSFKMGHSTLQVMLMMVLMVCSAHRVPLTPCKMALHKIDATVDILLEEEWANIMVVKPLSNLHRCPKCFFCLAEKVVENAREENVETNKLSNLITNFKLYNKHCPTNCTLHKDHRYPLRKFLEEVKKCVQHFLNKKPQKKEMNNKDC